MPSPKRGASPSSEVGHIGSDPNGSEKVKPGNENTTAGSPDTKKQLTDVTHVTTISKDNEATNEYSTALEGDKEHDDDSSSSADTEVPPELSNDRSAHYKKDNSMPTTTTISPKAKETDADEQPEKEVVSPPQLERVATADRPYSIFSGRQKALIVLVATLGGCFSPFTTNIYFPAITTISRDLSVSVSQVNFSITTYMIFQGVAPSFISAVADVRGRRPAYVIGFIVYMGANLGLALNGNYAGLLVLRAVQSCGSAGMITLQQGIIADVVTSAERGKYIAITSLSGILGPSVAPILGGVLAGHLGWHSVFWFLLIAAGVYFVPLILLFPETGRSVVGDGSIPPPKWNRCLLDLTKRRKADLEKGAALTRQTSVPDKVVRRRINPFATFAIIRDPTTALLLVYTALVYAGFYAISTSLTVQFEHIYGLDSTLQGLLFLPQAVGSILASVTNTRLLDANFRRHASKAGITIDRKRQTVMDEMPVERARLELAAPAFALGGVLIVVYGWLLHARVSIAGPIVLLVFIGYMTLAGFNCLTVLLIDLHRRNAATAAAASNLVRCLLGAGAAAVVNPVIDAVGVGWTFTIVGAVYLLTLPSLFVCMNRGMAWRKKRRAREQVRDKARQEKMQLKEQRKEEKKQQKQTQMTQKSSAR